MLFFLLEPDLESSHSSGSMMMGRSDDGESMETLRSEGFPISITNSVGSLLYSGGIKFSNLETFLNI